MTKLVFDDVTTQRLFGHEAAEDEDPGRLRQYYFKSSIFDRVTADLPLRILVGHKGLGKSALFQVAKQQDAEEKILALLLRPDDVHEVVASADILTATRNWKEGLLRIILNKTLATLGLKEEADSGWFNSGLQVIDKVVSIFKPVLQKTVDLDAAKKEIATTLIKKKLIRIYIDDLDRGWNASAASIARLSSLLNAARDLVKEHAGLQFRISLRSDVYYLVRTSDESTDKIEGSVVWYSWNNHEILAMLVKRVRSFFGREYTEEELVNMSQYALASLLGKVMEDRFLGYGKWANIPTYRMLMSLIRRRPRDLVKLCTLAAHSAFKRKADKLGTNDFNAAFEQYSQGRLQDTINEYRSELPNLDRLLLSMKPSRQKKKHGNLYFFTTADLLKKIRDIQSMNEPFLFYGGKKATDKDLAAFLYKINFLTGRKDVAGKISRQFFEDSQYLSSSFVDFGYDWEIHPAYRWALRPGESNEVISELEDVEL